MNSLAAGDYTWARELLQDIDEGRARGNRLALRIRSRIQGALFRIGCLSQRHCGKVVLLGFVFLCIFAIGLTRAKLETNAEKLWVEVGGRLEKELRYTEAALGKEFGSTQEIVIQTPNYKGTNILTVEALLLHQKALKKAAKLKVRVADRDWSLKDLCYAPSFPPFYNSMLDQIMHHLVPCAIITPMDCFWEGAKIHGPEIDMTLPDDSQRNYLKWTSLNPIGLLNQIQEISSFSSWEMRKIRTLFKEAGITTGYLEKPCLNPKDPGCPSLAPNFHSREVPDIGAELTGGCNGFAAKFMEWPEEIIVGDVTKNRSGTIRSASALQSVVLLMGVNNLYDYHHERYWTSKGSYEWNLDIAREVLETWQKEFTKTMSQVTEETTEEFSVLAFTSASFNELLKDFSKTSTLRLAMGYVLMLIYSGLTLKRWNDAVQSQGALGVAGVVLVTLAVASGLGFCAFCGIAFNASSTQVLPFLALGLGVDDMFILAHTYASISERGGIHPSDQVGYTLGRTGVSIFLTSFNNMLAFLMAAIIPIPALRAFSFQAAVIVVFNYFAVIIVFPAMIAIDVSRKRDQRFDFCCCIQRDGPQRISITPNSTTDSAMVLRRFHNSCSSLSSVTNSGITAGAVVLPGSVQATALGTVSLPGTVRVQASAVAEISNGATSVYNTMLPLSVSGLNSDVNTTDGRTRVGAGCRVERNIVREQPTDTSTDIVASRSNAVRQDIVRTVPKTKKHVSRNNVNNRTIEVVSSRPVGRTSEQSVRDSSRNSSQNRALESKWDKLKRMLRVFSLAYFAKYYYGPFLQKSSTKWVVMFLFAGMFGASIYGCLHVRDGLDLTDVVPKNSTEHKFVTAQYKYFSFYSIFAVTMKDFDYSKGQKLLYKYHDAFKRVSNVIKTPEMDLQPFWLMYFRDWLKDVQKSFDQDWASGTIMYTGWQENASDSGILGYKMLAQTGDEDYPVNRSQVRSVRLVDAQGIIRPQVFYHYLTVWYNEDTMGFTTSQGNLRPKPSNWNNNRDSKEPRNMKIEPAPPIEFAQLPFYLVDMKETAHFVRVIKEVREICDEFKDKGLPSYPSGIPFTFWEQYVWLRHNLLIAILVILVVSFLVVMTVLCNLKAAVIIVVSLIMITVQVFGFMGMAGVKLSAVPAVTLILSVGVGVEFTVHMSLAFLTATGDKNSRMQKAIEQMFSPIMDGAVSTFLGVVMLAGSDFDFIVRYFFHLLCALIMVGVTNGLVLLPVFLSVGGPAPEVEEVRPPGTASSAGSQRELLPVSSCRRGTPPTDSQICILDTSGYHDNRQEEKTDTSRHHRKRPRGENHHNRRVHASSSHKSNSPSRVTYDLESSSSVVARVTATATVTVQVHTEQIPNERTISERVHENVQTNRSTQPEREQVQRDEITVEDLEEHTQVK